MSEDRGIANQEGQITVRISDIGIQRKIAH